jgi:hypothetical protein
MLVFFRFQTGVLYMKDVPFELKGRQRAEFTVHIVDLENLSNRAQVNVSVDLLFPDPAVSREDTTTVEGVETTPAREHLHEGGVDSGAEEGR